MLSVVSCAGTRTRRRVPQNVNVTETRRFRFRCPSWTLLPFWSSKIDVSPISGGFSEICPLMSVKGSVTFRYSMTSSCTHRVGLHDDITSGGSVGNRLRGRQCGITASSSRIVPVRRRRGRFERLSIRYRFHRIKKHVTIRCRRTRCRRFRFPRSAKVCIGPVGVYRSD